MREAGMKPTEYRGRGRATTLRSLWAPWSSYTSTASRTGGFDIEMIVGRCVAEVYGRHAGTQAGHKLELTDECSTA